MAGGVPAARMEGKKKSGRRSMAQHEQKTPSTLTRRRSSASVVRARLVASEQCAICVNQGRAQLLNVTLKAGALNLRDTQGTLGKIEAQGKVTRGRGRGLATGETKGNRGYGMPKIVC